MRDTGRAPVTNPDGALRIAFLGSGSAGNATAVTSGETTVLVDVGLSARETLRRLQETGVDGAGVAAIVVTHEHSDHLKGVRVLARRIGVPVYASPGTRLAAALDELVDDVRTLSAGEHIRVGNLDVGAFRVSHDAADPIGVRFESACGATFGLATDTGELTSETLEAMAACQVIGLECNHDVDMLLAGPYPYFLKQRIMSARGHLSNDDAARGLERLAHPGLRAVIGVHVSRTNNEAARATSALAEALARLGHPAEVSCAVQARACCVEVPAALRRGTV